mmetsp:Transcript_22061/g.62024  ORF Transcript_22061/g.62024 Transcript_22061/m.62024 type:complete len:270 (-) Transcript_22061:1649-2458(-)
MGSPCRTTKHCWCMPRLPRCDATMAHILLLRSVSRAGSRVRAWSSCGVGSSPSPNTSFMNVPPSDLPKNRIMIRPLSMRYAPSGARTSTEAGMGAGSTTPDPPSAGFPTCESGSVAMVWTGYTRGYRILHVWGTSMAPMSYAVVARSSAMTSPEPPRSAGLFMEPSVSSGSSLSASGKISLLWACRWALYIMRYSLITFTVLSCTAPLESFSVALLVFSTPSLASSAAHAAPSAALYSSATSATTGMAMVCTRIRRSPEDDVYSRAHCM